LVIAVFLQQLVRAITSRGVAPHYGFLAQAFLHGRADIPIALFDVAPYRGHLYVPMGPLPGLLFTPLVAMAGPYLPIVILDVLVAAVTLPLLPRLWRLLGVDDLDLGRWLSLGAVAGTVYFTSMVANASYQTGHVVAFGFLLGALVLALSDRLPLLCGLLVGLAGVSRQVEVLAIIPLALLYAGPGRPGRMRAFFALALGVAPVVAALAAYNWARFGTPLENGYQYQVQFYPPLVEAFRTGVFSLAHVPKNLYYALIASPVPVGGPDTPLLRFPWLEPSPWGMGLIWVSPWLLLAIAARGRRARVLAIGIVLVMIPDMLWWGTGWAQFGYRYLMDAMPLLLALVALACARRSVARLVPPLVTASVLVNMWGAQF
jgi:hypothetical protein